MAIRRMLREASLIVNCAYAVHPTPQLGETSRRLSDVPGLPSAVTAMVLDLEHTVRVVDREGAERDAADLVVNLRRHAGSEAFPTSFESTRGLRETLEVGYDWIRISAHLDASFPNDQARDLISTGDHQPGVHARMPPDPVGSDRSASPGWQPLDTLVRTASGGEVTE